MSGQQVGYTRVSSLDQNPDRQLDVSRWTGRSPTARRAAARPDRSWRRCWRSRATATPWFVHSMDRLARNLDDLRALVRTLTARGVRVQFVKEQLTFTGEDTAMATLLLSVMGAFAEFERSLIRERQREGIALARKRGAYRGRARALRQRAAEGTPKATLAREFGISRETVCQYLRTTS
jgi:DNA invertase Pin-like site-specific DNA recombinase